MSGSLVEGSRHACAYHSWCCHYAQTKARMMNSYEVCGPRWLEEEVAHGRAKRLTCRRVLEAPCLGRSGVPAVKARWSLGTA